MYSPIVDDGLDAELLGVLDHPIAKRFAYPYRVV